MYMYLAIKLRLCVNQFVMHTCILLTGSESDDKCIFPLNGGPLLLVVRILGSFVLKSPRGGFLASCSLSLVSESNSRAKQHRRLIRNSCGWSNQSSGGTWNFGSTRKELQ